MENIIPRTDSSGPSSFSVLSRRTRVVHSPCNGIPSSRPIIQGLVGTKAAHVSSICPLFPRPSLPPAPPFLAVSQRACFGIICDTGIFHLLISRKAARSERLPPVSHGGKRVVTEFLVVERSCTRVTSLLFSCHLRSLSRRREKERDRRAVRRKGREKEIARVHNDGVGLEESTPLPSTHRCA